MKESSPRTASKVQFKVVLVGDKAVGKTSIVKRYVEDTFEPGVDSTIGASFFSKVVSVKAEGGGLPTDVKLQIWDTAGEEKFRSLTPMYYKNASAVLCVYDCCSKDSFESVGKWAKEIEDKGTGDVAMILVANKCDMAEQQEVPVHVGME